MNLRINHLHWQQASQIPNRGTLAIDLQAAPSSGNFYPEAVRVPLAVELSVDR